MDEYLLDTHTAIWYFNGDSKLSETARRIILDPSSRKWLSIISVWELSIKISSGKLDFAGGARGFARLAEDNDFPILPITIDHLAVLEGLPFHHRDPFDRLLIAAAIAEEMTLLTADGNIPRYDLHLAW